VTLSIDEGIQHVAERELDAAMRTYETKGGRSSSSIRTPARSSPSPARLGTTPTTTPTAIPTRAATRAVTDRFEPGSVMKPFTIAAALAPAP
jgi:cell division protein FtsI (penicillin-binding protein 3)